MLGALVGLVLGNLRLPLLLAVTTPAAAVGTNMAVSTSGATVAVAAHLREGNFDARAFWATPPTSAAEASVGPVPTGLQGRQRMQLALAGLGIGLLGGLVGLILGSLRLPAMLRLGVTVRDGIATNLAVGVLVGIAGVIGHLLGSSVDLWLVVVLVPAVGLGALAGVRLSGRFTETGLRQAIGLVLVGIGLLLLAQSAQDLLR